MQSDQLLGYLQKGVARLLEQGCFEGGQPFRPTQREALEAYNRYLHSNSLGTAEKLKGFFELPTGIGKTAVFVGIVAAAHAVAAEEGVTLKTVIVVPTTQLLGQTKEAFEGIDGKSGFAPTLKGHIGLYGNGHKNLKHPLTIMTYNAWYDLSQAGTIGSHNVDILISDEAHRGTSDRRIENITGIFNEQTAQIAFTATAHFDEEKSVQASHEREIFYKSIRDAILEDELASYVQSQRAVIRVAPTAFMLTDEFKNATQEQKTDYRKKIRQKAWNEFAVKAYRDGHDEHTGDLLTDNQASFFVEGIDQADKLEKMLNTDPELQQRAKAQGYKGVAVSIHSGMSAKEQNRRFEAYKSGEYMAVVGDEKFKEGFDHPPMKTVIDSAHGSLVDKAQILGRGARKWWNEKKGRFEGLTVIDTVIYIGSEDKNEDKRLRATALCKAVAVKDILEESYIVGPTAPKAKKPVGGGGGPIGPSLFNGDEVEYYGSVEDMHKLESEISKFRKEDWIDISEEMRANLNSEIERTGYGPYRLTGVEDFPENLTASIISSWRVNNDVKRARIVHWGWVINTLKILPDGDPVLQITEQLRSNFNSELLRVGIGKKKLVTLINDSECPSVDELEHWSRGAFKVSAKQWKIVMDALGLLPSASKISEDVLQDLNNEFKRTNAQIDSLLKLKDVPIGLNRRRIQKWRAEGGNITLNDSEGLQWLFNILRKMPDVIQITDAMREELNLHIVRTGVGTANLLKNNSNPPEGLDRYQEIERWRYGSKSAVIKEHWEWVLGLYFSMPAGDPRKSKNLVLISEENKRKIEGEKKRTGVGEYALCSYLEVTFSGKYKKSSVCKIIQGTVKAADPEVINMILEIYKSLPDKDAKPSGYKPEDPSL